MKNIPIALVDRLARPTGSWAYLAKVVSRKDGSVYGFTTLDSDIRFNDGLHTVVYDCSNELRPQNIQQDLTYEPDTTDLLGWFNKVLEKLILAGRFDRAELTIYRVSYLHLEDGAEVMAYGTVGEVDFASNAKSKRKVEYVSLKGQLEQNVNQMYSLTCRTEYGSDECGMPFVWENGSVTGVGSSPYLAFRVTGPSRPAGYYDFGVIEMLTGDNTGAELEVESWTADGTVQLSFLAPYPMKNGDTLRIRVDCGKTEIDCKAKGNIINMRAEHLTPTEEAGVMVPGAYIKSVNAK